MQTLSELELNELKSTIQGKILFPTEEGYDAARTIWNGMIDKRPSLICQCASQSDVINAVNFARKHDILISVKSGGHNVAGNAVCDGGLMIDLSQMKGIKIDIENQTVVAESGLLWNELDAETQKYGLATTGGTVSHTGVAGLTLGGGLGWLMGKHGLTCDNLISAEIVLANGETLTVNETENTDIFWAIRGGGGNFGIVTSFTFQLHKVGPNIIGGMILYPRDAAPEVLKFYREFARTTPDELMIFASLMYTPDGIPVIALLVGWLGDLSEGEKYIKPIRDFGSPIVDLVAEMPYAALNSLIDAAVPHGMGRYWKSGFLPEIKDELIDTIMEQAAIQPSPYSFILFFHVKGKAARIEPESTAYGNRGDLWDFDIVSQWADPAEASKNTEWVRDFFAKVEPHTKGVYVNHLDVDDGNARVKAAYGKNYERLLNIKRKYDPTNFFRLNNNIVP